MRCPKCNYLLVLRKHRRKYKCSKCGGVFKQQVLDLKYFLQFNKSEKIKDITALQNEIETRIQKLIEEMSITQAFNSIIGECNKRQSALFERILDRDKYNQKKREYWAKCHEHLLEKRKENYIRNKDKIRRQQKQYHDKNKTLRRINRLRTQQKKLALQMIENGTINLYNF